MSIPLTHKPEYFLFAQLFIRHLETQIKKHPQANPAVFDMNAVYQMFQHDLAATTTNLEGILNIADEYKVETPSGDKKLISGFKLDTEQNTLAIDLDTEALVSYLKGNGLITPDATIQE